MTGGPAFRLPPSMNLTALAGEIRTSRCAYSNGRSESDNEIVETPRLISHRAAVRENAGNT